jgi:hypothetical protein
MRSHADRSIFTLEKESHQGMFCVSIIPQEEHLTSSGNYSSLSMLMFHVISQHGRFAYYYQGNHSGWTEGN